ncbi:MAG TPA: PAS domain S-box protein [Polyangiaceae bacterium]|nr:PAS domain S-box protein [Polyangiaceae bacterium]
MSPLGFEPYRSLIEHVPVMIWSAGVDGGCDYVNAAWCAFTGRPRDETLGDGWQASIHPEDLERFLALYVDHFARRTAFEAECRVRRHDGVHCSLVVRAAPRGAPSGDFAGFVAACSGVHDGAAGAAHAAGDFFELLLDHVCVSGFDGYWKRLNPAWSRTLGFTQQELLSRPVIEFVHPEDREATLSARANLKRGEPLLTLTNRYLCKGGAYRWFEWKSVSDVPRQLVYAVARDVTAEHEVRRALRELNENLKATLNSMADGVIATDAQGAVVRMNPVAEALTGWGAGEAKGRSLGSVFTIVHADTHASAPLPFERTLQQGLVSEGTEHTILVARDGTELPIAFSRAPLRDSRDGVSGAVIVFRDMTAEKQAKMEQERLQRQLVFADRMASVGTLAAGVAHEINNPLTFVMANVDVIVDELRNADASSLSAHRAEWLEMLEEARHGTDRIRRIVRGLKTFSRAEEERRAARAPASPRAGDRHGVQRDPAPRTAGERLRPHAARRGRRLPARPALRQPAGQRGASPRRRGSSNE